MKTTTKKLLFLFLTTLTLYSCNMGMFNGVQGDRNVITENRTPNEEFTKIKVSSGLDLYVNQGDISKVVLEADQNLHELIKTEVRDGELRIYTEKNIWNAKARKVYVTINELESLRATSGADVYTEEELNVNSIYVGATSGADIKVKLNAVNVESNATSGAGIKISGESDSHSSSASSGASIQAYDLKSKNVKVSVSSGADINIFASESINANANSGGDIDFRGNPKQVNKSSNSGGSVSKK